LKEFKIILEKAEEKFNFEKFANVLLYRLSVSSWRTNYFIFKKLGYWRLFSPLLKQYFNCKTPVLLCCYESHLLQKFSWSKENFKNFVVVQACWVFKIFCFGKISFRVVTVMKPWPLTIYMITVFTHRIGSQKRN